MLTDYERVKLRDAGYTANPFILAALVLAGIVAALLVLADVALFAAWLSEACGDAAPYAGLVGGLVGWGLWYGVILGRD